MTTYVLIFIIIIIMAYIGHIYKKFSDMELEMDKMQSEIKSLLRALEKSFSQFDLVLATLMRDFYKIYPLLSTKIRSWEIYGKWETYKKQYRKKENNNE